MPYISKQERIVQYPTETVGQLTYSLTRLCLLFVKSNGKKFATFAWVMGALVCTALEFYRRVVVNYENVKMQENGDVYDV
jgi:hypothetical protein